MDNELKSIIAAFGGITEMARILETRPSTVFNWMKRGIPPSRMAHIKLAAKENDISLPCR